MMTLVRVGQYLRYDSFEGNFHRGYSSEAKSSPKSKVLKDCLYKVPWESTLKEELPVTEFLRIGIL